MSKHAHVYVYVCMFKIGAIAEFDNENSDLTLDVGSDVFMCVLGLICIRTLG